MNYRYSKLGLKHKFFRKKDRQPKFYSLSKATVRHHFCIRGSNKDPIFGSLLGSTVDRLRPGRVLRKRENCP